LYFTRENILVDSLYVFAATLVINSSGPVTSLEEFEPDEGIDASFLEDTSTPMTATVTTSQHDVPSES